MEKQDRRAARAQREELLTLVNGWDPTGALAAGAPRNQYDRIIEPLFTFLASGASEDEIRDFLDREIRDQFCSTPRDTAQFAKKAATWFRLSRSE